MRFYKGKHHQKTNKTRARTQGDAVLWYTFPMTHPSPIAYDILHICAGCWACGGGLSEVVAQLLLAQTKLGLKVGLVYLDDYPEHPLLQACRAAGATVIPLHRRLRDPFFFSIKLLRQLPHLVAQSRQVFLHGAWTFPIYWGAKCARKAAVPYAVFSHGSLDPVRRAYGKRRKALVWKLFDRNVLRHATWIHAASDWEARWIRDALAPLPCPPLRQTPLGVDGETFDATATQPRTQTFLYLGRNHPLKGLDLLLEAWRQAHLDPSWQLHLATPEPITIPLPEGVHAIGPLQGEAKARALKSAACLILPSRSESFGLVVAEALWCRTPVICTQGAPWKMLGDFWVETSAEALADALKRFVALTPDARESHFKSHFDSARTLFSWANIAQQLHKPLA